MNSGLNMFLFAEVGQENLIASLLDFRSNILNWIILIILLAWAIKKFVPSLITHRQQMINAELDLAAKTREEAEEILAAQKLAIEQAGQEVEKIISEAKYTANQMATDMKQQNENDIADLRKKFELAAHNERQAAILEMRNIVSKAAIQLAQENLTSTLTANNKAKIANEFMGELSKVGSSNISGETLNSEVSTARDSQRVSQT